MILIYSPQISNRLRYTVQFILEDVCKQEYDFTTDVQYFKSFSSCKINYSTTRITDQELFIIPNGLLSEDGIQHFDIPILKSNDKIFLFPKKESDTGFDLFSATFYLISRYEEYLPFQKDKHGRFEANQSFAFKNEFLDRPLVDEWIIEFQHLLSEKCPELVWEKRTFTYTPTIDIDQAFKIKGKSFFRIAKPLLLSFLTFNFSKLIYTLQVYFGFKKDPFDQFSELENLHSKYGFKAIYFFLFGRKYNKYDINISIRNKDFRNRIKYVSKTADIGIHPSYQSRYDFKIIDNEIQLLSNVLNIPIKSSRQHFLKMRMPNTYKSLLSLGIAKEYTMGYASMPGFRASTSHPFRFYDIKHEQVSFLKVFPFCVMDATFKTYLNCNENEAFEHIKKLMQNVKRVNGNFTSLWHNESLSETDPWKGWSGLYEKMLKLAKEN